MELTLEEQTLLAAFRSLDDSGKKEVVRYANLQHKLQHAAASTGATPPAGCCRLERSEERPEIAPEPIFTE